MSVFNDFNKPPWWCIIISMLATRVEGGQLDHRMGQTKNIKIGFCCFPAKQLGSKSKDLSA